MNIYTLLLMCIILLGGCELTSPEPWQSDNNGGGDSSSAKPPAGPGGSNNTH